MNFKNLSVKMSSKRTITTECVREEELNGACTDCGCCESTRSVMYDDLMNDQKAPSDAELDVPEYHVETVLFTCSICKDERAQVVRVYEHTEWADVIESLEEGCLRCREMIEKRLATEFDVPEPDSAMDDPISRGTLPRVWSDDLPF